MNFTLKFLQICFDSDILSLEVIVMNKLNELKKQLRPGKVYRREDLAAWSSAVDRHLKELTDAGDLVKAAPGIYYAPKATAFGKAPADDKSLVQSYLKDDCFLITNPSAYNALGVGATQLYNRTVVYNRKRHGDVELGGRKFEFRVKPHFPRKLTREFMMVDLVNNLDSLAEDRDMLLARLRDKVQDVDPSTLNQAVSRYGAVRTKKFFRDAVGHGIS